MASEADNIPFENIFDFHVCSKQTEQARKLKPDAPEVLCVPEFVQVWQDTSAISLTEKPLLTEQSFLLCVHGGLITPLTNGQGPLEQEQMMKMLWMKQFGFDSYTVGLM